MNNFSFDGKEDFVQKVTTLIAAKAQKDGVLSPKISLEVGLHTPLLLISGFDLNTFNGQQNVRVQRL